MKIIEANLTHTTIVYHFMNLLENTQFDFATFKQVYHRLLKDEQHFLYIAFKEETPLGFIHLETRYQLHHNGKTAEIVELIVDEKYRCLGIGATLFHHAIEKATQQQCLQIELSSSLWRKQAHQFYEREGMRKDHYNFKLPLKKDVGTS